MSVSNSLQIRSKMADLLLFNWFQNGRLLLDFALCEFWW